MINLTTLAKEIAHLDYVVQRNWDDLPEDMGGDLDVFVSLKDKEEFTMIIKGNGMEQYTDIRYPGDGYYPPAIEQEILLDTSLFNGFKVPSVRAHFLSLYYHSVVHKLDHPYKDKLKKLFLEWFPPTEPDDKGVTYNV